MNFPRSSSSGFRFSGSAAALPGLGREEGIVNHAERIRHADQPLHRPQLLRAARQRLEKRQRETCAGPAQEMTAGDEREVVHELGIFEQLRGGERFK